VIKFASLLLKERTLQSAYVAGSDLCNYEKDWALWRELHYTVCKEEVADRNRKKENVVDKLLKFEMIALTSTKFSDMAKHV
jgi:hypothetical protein